MKAISLSILFSLVVYCSHSQNTKQLRVAFRPCLKNEQTLILDSTYPLNNRCTIRIENLRYYISGIELFNNHQLVWREKNSYHLIDIAKYTTQQLALSPPKNIQFNAIRFNLGIDSSTNVSGALAGDLDPTKGMYWTWQSGYINLKIDGKYSTDSTAIQPFEYHLGGYMLPFKTIQTVELPVTIQENITILFDVQKFFESIDLQKTNHIVSPNEEAVTLSTLVAKCFRLP